MINTQPYVEAALDSLRAGLDERVAELNAARGLADEDAVPAFEGYSDGTEDVLRYPWVEVAAPDWRLYDLSLAHQEGDLDVQIVVRAQLRDAQVKRLYGKLQLVGAAVCDVLLAPNAFSQNATVREVRGTYPVNPEAEGERLELSGSALLIFTVAAVDVRE